MANEIREYMTTDIVTIDVREGVDEAARRMRENDVGDIIVLQGGDLHGMITDRDIVVRVIAEGLDVASTTVADACTSRLHTLSPGSSLDEAIELTRTQAVRRIPIVEDGAVVGILGLADLAILVDPSSVLADISAAPTDDA